MVDLQKILIVFVIIIISSLLPLFVVFLVIVGNEYIAMILYLDYVGCAKLFYT